MPSSLPPSDANPRITIDVHLDEPDVESVRRELITGLTGSPRAISAKYFYDDRGSQLFEQICELPEYYQTRTEAAILRAHAATIVRRNDNRDLIELGSGAATKSRILLDAMAAAGQLERYVPVDVSEGIVRRVAQELITEYPGLRVHGLIADFMHDLGALPDGHHRLVAFLGGTIGNLDPEIDGPRMLRHVAEAMAEDDYLLLGVDLIKDSAEIEAAYNDSQGVTAAFNRNALRVVNDRFGANFAPEQFDHRAFYDTTRNRIEMWLVARRPQTVEIRDLDLTLTLTRNEAIRTEISTKFDRPRVEKLFAASGFRFVDSYTDEARRFGLVVGTPDR